MTHPAVMKNISSPTSPLVISSSPAPIDRSFSVDASCRTNAGSVTASLKGLSSDTPRRYDSTRSW